MFLCDVHFCFLLSASISLLLVYPPPPPYNTESMSFVCVLLRDSDKEVVYHATLALSELKTDSSSFPSEAEQKAMSNVEQLLSSAVRQQPPVLPRAQPRTNPLTGHVSG